MQAGPLSPPPAGSGSARGRDRGQSLIESCIVLAVLCLVFLGVFQVSQLLAAKEVLGYSAGRGLRAKTVGFNRFMVYKTIRVGAIPAAGEMLNPDDAGGPAAQYDLERPRIPLYLGGESFAVLPGILDYERWSDMRHSDPFPSADGTLSLTVSQEYPLNIAFHRAFYDDDSVRLRSDSKRTGPVAIESHYDLYMNNENF